MKVKKREAAGYKEAVAECSLELPELTELPELLELQRPSGGHGDCCC